ncbi:MAG TPA: hypothetical protein PKA27_03010 [Fimbriimonadaceae bacterium]|nr:hypothetical protein [Fimbriimonadaceae bacterium]
MASALAIVGLGATISALELKPRVAICAAASASVTAAQFTDPQAKLVSTNMFATVDIIHAGTSTPLVSQLSDYDAVMVWSNTNFQNSTTLGDNLADYVDAGGGVVVTMFANSTTSANRFLLGRWSPNYEVIPKNGGNLSSGGAQGLGNILVPGHPILNGVNSFTAGTSAFRPVSILLQPGCTLIAQWTDGKTLIAVGTTDKRVDLGMYPPSSDVVSTYWSAASDGAKLMGNALDFARAWHWYVPDTYTVDSGEEFGGDLQSLVASDDNSLQVFNDATSLVAQVSMSINGGFTNPSAMRVMAETSVARPGLSEAILMEDFINGGYDVLIGRVATTTDTLATVDLTTSAATYVSGSGGMNGRVTWMPINDEDPSQDGWLHTVDMFKVRLTE